jgi:hypothetical protein
LTLSVGSRLGPYEVLAPLGTGGMGEVWRARDTRLSREVAIKVPARGRRLGSVEAEAVRDRGSIGVGLEPVNPRSGCGLRIAMLIDIRRFR